MLEILPDRVPWYVVGPLIGLLVAGLYAVANRPLGVSGAYLEVIGMFRDRPRPDAWRVWYFGGIILGGAVAAFLQGRLALGLGYGTLGALLPLPLLAVVLFAGGTLMGYGARWAGGCTSGHGLCGNARLSPASFVATLTFMASAVVVTFVLHLVTGGAL
jgi:uncharacterized membrane protein YedE/YeeE